MVRAAFYYRWKDFLINIWQFRFFALSLQRKNKSRKYMEATKKFATRTEQVNWYNQQKGWGTLTEEDRVILDDAVRSITKLD